MGEKMLMFGCIEIGKKNYHSYYHSSTRKTPIFLGDVDIKKVLVSN